MQNRHTAQIRFRNNVSAKEPPFQSCFDFNIEIEIRHLRFLIITLGMSLHFNHIASCRKSRYHCPCHKATKKPPAILSFKRRREAILLQLFFILMTSFLAMPSTPSVVGQRRWCQRFLILLCLETIHKNCFEGSCPQVTFSSINWKLFITLKCRIRYIFLT